MRNFIKEALALQRQQPKPETKEDFIQLLQNANLKSCDRIFWNTKG